MCETTNQMSMILASFWSFWIRRFCLRHTCCQVPCWCLGVLSGHVRQASTQMPTLLQYGPRSTNSCSLLCFPQVAFFFKAGHCQFWELGTKWYTTLAESTQFAQPNVSRLPCSLSQRVDRTCCLHIGFLAPWRISLSTRTNSVKS